MPSPQESSGYPRRSGGQENRTTPRARRRCRGAECASTFRRQRDWSGRKRRVEQRQAGQGKQDECNRRQPVVGAIRRFVTLDQIVVLHEASFPHPALSIDPLHSEEQLVPRERVWVRGTG